MTCKDCIHYDVCYFYDGVMDLQNGDRCSEYKDKSRFIELPCKVGDTVCALDDVFKAYHDATVTKIEFNKFTDPQMWIEFEYNSNIFGHITKKSRIDLLLGKTVFLTREEAEEKLKELQEKEK